MEWKFIAIGLMAFGMLGAAIGVGLIFNGAAQAIARNPAAEGKIRGISILGAALAEGLGVFSLVVALILMFVVQ